jgi:hypothetical protein
VNVNLIDRPSNGDGKREDKANGGGFDNWTVGLTKVNTGLLVETLGDEACFVAINGAISFAFKAENPLAANNVHVGGLRNESPSAVAEEGIKLNVHGITPGRVLGGSRIGGRFNVIGASGGDERFGKRVADEAVRKSLRFEYVVLRASLHTMLRRGQHRWGIRALGENLQRRKC